ncbi:MAG: DUF2788 domain-containing protein [Cellvibrionaceae bacterium]|nr:DUF2788 domain-containing protein [Cellvibrionaceae bacterium]
MSIETFETTALYLCVGGLLVFMVFIMWDLAKRSNAGRFGTFILFIALGIGLLGFVIKTVLVRVIA